jgi:cysteine desulfurase family protein
MNAERIYLDHAATSWPKLPGVLAAMNDYAVDCGAAAGRGNYRSAQQADVVIAAARRSLARLIDAESAAAISLHPSGTAALNAAIHGLLRPGDHVISTAADHNSVLRPLHHLQQHAGIELTIVPCDETGLVAAADVAAALRSETRLVAVTHASNVTGTVEPIEEIGRILRNHPARLLCDAAQTLGYLPIDVQASHIDLLAAPGHKGAGGPAGTGLLYVTAEVQPEIVPLIQGGTGSQSESLEMPADFPAKVEAGNLNVPAIAGWVVGLEQLESFRHGRQTGAQLARRLHQELGAVAGVRVYGSPGPLPMASVQVQGMSPSDAAAILDAEFNIETRAGLHCAALIHDCLGSGDEGTLRISGGHTTTEAEIETVCDALRAIAAELATS